MPLMQKTSALALALALSGVPSAPLSAQQPAAVTPIEVSNFTCRTAQPPGAPSSQAWWEASVELNARSAPGTRFTGRVKVALTLGFEKGLSKEVEFYQSSVELVALEAGRVSTVRFYLPPEITKRDGLRGAPKYHVVSVTNAGKEMPATAASRASAFTGAAMLGNFLAKAAADGAANAGLLVPQHLTPFWQDATRPSPTPLRAGGNSNN